MTLGERMDVPEFIEGRESIEGTCPRAAGGMNLAVFPAIVL